MKKLLLLLLLTPVFAISQDYLSEFFYRNDDFIWIKEYPTTMDFASFKRAVIESGTIQEISSVDSSFSGRVVSMKPNHKGSGLKEGRAPMYLINNYIGGFVVIEYLGDKYTVTLKQLNIITGKDFRSDSRDPIIQALFDQRAGEQEPLETYAMKPDKKHFRKNFVGDAGLLVSNTFTKRFAF